MFLSYSSMIHVFVFNVFGVKCILHNKGDDALASILLVPDKRAFLITLGAPDIFGCALVIVILDVTFAEIRWETTFIHNLHNRTGNIDRPKNKMNCWNASGMFFYCNSVNNVSASKACKVCCAYSTRNMIVTISVI